MIFGTSWDTVYRAVDWVVRLVFTHNCLAQKFENTGLSNSEAVYQHSLWSRSAPQVVARINRPKPCMGFTAAQFLEHLRRSSIIHHQTPGALRAPGLCC